MSALTKISDLFKKILAWAKTVEAKLHSPISVAEAVLNALKSPAGQTALVIIETVIPSSTGLVEAFKVQLPIWLKALNMIDAEVSNKTLDEQWQDALNYLNSIDNKDVTASQWNTLKGLFIKFFAQDAVTIQQSLTLAQPTHDIKTIA